MLTVCVSVCVLACVQIMSELCTERAAAMLLCAVREEATRLHTLGQITANECGRLMERFGDRMTYIHKHPRFDVDHGNASDVHNIPHFQSIRKDAFLAMWDTKIGSDPVAYKVQEVIAKQVRLYLLCERGNREYFEPA